VLDPRIYRAGWLPAIVALALCAFSLEGAGRPSTSALAPDAFVGERALTSPGTGLRDLAATFPRRGPGSPGDRRLATRVAQTFEQRGLKVERREFEAGTVDGRRRLENVSGLRAGLSNRRIVVIAHRDSVHSPATADLSGTAALLELARIFEGQALTKTLVLVSTSGGSGGATGAREWARHVEGQVDAVVALGDLASRRARGPLVVPWSSGPQIAPLELRRTVTRALALEAERRAQEPRLPAQVARLAFPLTPGEQGVVNAEHLPAVLLSVTGERGPGASTAVSEGRLQQYGRAVLRTINALDGRRASISRPDDALVLRGKLVPPWAVRLLAATLVLPLLLAAVDGFARVRRRRQRVAMWMRWTLAGALPFVLALGFAFLMDLLALLPDAPPGPVAAGEIPLDGAGATALAALALVLLLGWLGARPLALAVARFRGSADEPGAAAGVALLAAGLLALVWAFNPFAALLLAPAGHAVLLVVVPEVRMRRGAALGLLALALIPVALLVVYYARQLGLSPFEVPWTALLLLVGGYVGLPGALTCCLLLGCLASALAIVGARAGVEPDATDPTTRGPVTYAGPGSLGGTESALRR
jgi:hypothetical protein